MSLFLFYFPLLFASFVHSHNSRWEFPDYAKAMTLSPALIFRRSVFMVHLFYL